MLGLSPSAVLAQTVPPQPITSFTSIISYINQAASWLFTIIVGLSLLFFLFAALLYLMSGGDTTKTAAAKNMLTYAIVALAVALVAGGIKFIIAQFFGVTLT